jgi:hypothetical protein
MPKTRYSRSILTLIAAGTMAGLVGACTRTMALQRDYQGPLPDAGQGSELSTGQQQDGTRTPQRYIASTAYHKYMDRRVASVG